MSVKRKSPDDVDGKDHDFDVIENENNSSIGDPDEEAD